MIQALSVIDIHKSFGSKTALAGVRFDVRPGETLGLLGPSGCGKSTLLNIIAGLEPADRGEVSWAGDSLAGVPAHKRRFGLMFQDYVLFPHLTVAQNIAFGPEMQGMVREKIQERVTELLDLVGLTGYAQRMTGTLSGGEQQRIALARALAPNPRLLMLDEPLAALDRPLREQLLGELRLILRTLGQTAIYVTHDQEEAFSIADRVAVMREGRIEQIGTPREIYSAPGNEFVARFLGFKNFLDARVVEMNETKYLKTVLGNLEAVEGEALSADKDHRVLIRPDGASLSPHAGSWTVQGRVVQKTFRGSRQIIDVDANGLQLAFEFPPGAELPAENQVVTLWITPSEVQIFL